MTAAREQAVLARRLLAVAVGGEAADLGAGLAGGNDVEDGRPGDAAQHLGDHVVHDLAPREAAADGEAHGDRRIEMRARDRRHGVGHGHHREAEGQRHAGKADAELGKGRGQHGAAAAAQDEPGRAEELGIEPVGHWLQIPPIGCCPLSSIWSWLAVGDSPAIQTRWQVSIWLLRCLACRMPPRQIAAPFICTSKSSNGRLFNGCLVASERLLTFFLSLATSARRDDVKNHHYRFENKHRTEPTPPFAPGVEHQHKPCRIPHLKVHSGASLHRLRSF